MNDDKFKIKMDKKFYQPNIFVKIWLAIITPFIIASTMSKFKNIATDPKAQKIRELNADDDYKNKYFASKEIPFEAIRK